MSRIQGIELCKGGIRCLALAAALSLGASLESRAEAGSAEDGKSRWGYYVTGLAGGSWATADAAGATLAGGPIAGSSQDESAFGGAALGTIVDLGPVDLRLELEGTGGRSFTFTSPSAAGPYATQADVWTLQGNFWFEYSLGRLFPDTPVVRNLAPFGGGGVGVSGISLTTGNGTDFGRGDEAKFAWQGGVGLSYQPRPWLSFEARYQYIDMGAPTVALSSAAGLQGEVEYDLGAHELVTGIRFTFSGL
jgi:opacity protein-like surface antigen